MEGLIPKWSVRAVLYARLPLLSMARGLAARWRMHAQTCSRTTALPGQETDSAAHSSGGSWWLHLVKAEKAPRSCFTTFSLGIRLVGHVIRAFAGRGAPPKALPIPAPNMVPPGMIPHALPRPFSSGGRGKGLMRGKGLIHQGRQASGQIRSKRRPLTPATHIECRRGRDAWLTKKSIAWQQEWAMIRPPWELSRSDE
jgi:hypothetical protein